jgi:Tfp pilus assembly protein FimV
VTTRHTASGDWRGLSVVGPAASRDVPGRRAARRSRAARRQLRRRRLAGLLRFAVFLLLIFIAVWAGVRVAHAGTDASVYTGHQYVVRSGDTLWTIAARQYGGGTDLRRAVFEIQQANQLSRAGLQPGAHLTLPYLGD